MTDRARRVGGWVGGPGVRYAVTHPLQPPIGLPGPASLVTAPLSVFGPLVAGPGYYPSPVPTRSHTPPQDPYPPDADMVPTTGSTVTTGMHI